MSRVRLALVLHNHQPIGNFDGVIEAAYHDSYQPWLDVLEQFPDIPFCLHTSGCLLEWLVARQPRYIDQLRRMITRGQAEILGGGFYEPILTMILPHDRRGQILGYRAYIEDVLGAEVAGMWVPERVWEQSLVADLAASAVEYTVLDDYHFQAAGIAADDLDGYFTTEDQGALLKVFPGSETLRYMIPFRDVHEILEHLGAIHQRRQDAVVVFADDGEKFGTWPETKAHVYERGWIHRFLEALRAHRHWIEPCTLRQAVDALPPRGHVYLPDASYREMTEWALSCDDYLKQRKLLHALETNADAREVRRFLRGGSWRQFKTKYPESMEMYARMMEVSRKLHQLGQGDRHFRDPSLHRARISLYRGQCNCAYWHGAFGGLYLPHLRNAVYSQLIEADNAMSLLGHEGEAFVETDERDFNCDGRDECRLANDKMIMFLAPHQGGCLYEWDIRQPAVNIGASLTRRPEPYHARLHDAHQNHAADGAQSIHDRVICKQENLHESIVYDSYARKSLIDHFLEPGTTLEEFSRGTHREQGDFVTSQYCASSVEDGFERGFLLERKGVVGGRLVEVAKTVLLSAGSDTVRCHYRIKGAKGACPLAFGVEWNFAGLATRAEDRYFISSDGQKRGKLGSILAEQRTREVTLVDEWLGLSIQLAASVPADIWSMPVSTVSQSDGGFELVDQSICVLLRWELSTADHWETELTVKISTFEQDAAPATLGAPPRRVSAF